jgi:hypothetical protein
MTTDDRLYPARLATCLATGHTPVLWRMDATTRVLCSNCGHTFPAEWLRLVTMTGIHPIQAPAAA